jgi:NTP pyrophosphatase (non-canonical NTP hydrolase)
MDLEEYLLVCLAEECAEVSHAVAKALRFGLNHEWPGRGVTNRDALRDELRDVFRLAERLKLDFVGLPDKGDKFARMMRLSFELGRLDEMQVGPKGEPIGETRARQRDRVLVSGDPNGDE